MTIELNVVIRRGGQPQIISPSAVPLLLTGWRTAVAADSRLGALHSPDLGYTPISLEGLPEYMQLGRALNGGRPDDVYAVLTQLLGEADKFFVEGYVHHELVGVAIFSSKWPCLDKRPVGFIHFATVAEYACRQGVMRRLLEAGIQELASRGVTELWAECMLGNQNALDAWRALGFKELFVSLRRDLTGDSQVTVP